MPYNFTRLRLGNWDLRWTKAGGVLHDFGAVDKVTPDIEIVTVPKKVGSVGDVELGEWIVALKGTIRAELREIDLTTLQKLMPWWTTGNISLIPATWHQDLYDYAGLLTLHPSDLPTATVTEDVHFLKAVPMFQPMARDGVAPDKLLATFKFYPDRAQLVAGAPLLSYGHIGTAPL